MRIWTVSDLHIDYPDNAQFVEQIAVGPYLNDLLIIPGDITHDFSLLQHYLKHLSTCFHKVLFIPGNHDLWIHKRDFDHSIQKFEAIQSFCHSEGITFAFQNEQIEIRPFYSWYDFSFGIPNPQIQRAWRDFKRCTWPFEFQEINPYFTDMNKPWLTERGTDDKIRISYSHFLPFAELIPHDVPKLVRSLLPVMGSDTLGEQIMKYNPNLHIYGHSHLNRIVFVNGIRCLNNAYAYPKEAYISRKRIMCIYDESLLT